MARPDPTKRPFHILNPDRSFNIVRRGGIDPFDLYHSLLSVKWFHFFLLVVVTYVSVNLVFATLYFLAGSDALDGFQLDSDLHRFQDCFFFSIQTLATIGYGKISPSTLMANVLVSVEALVGLLGVALTTGLFFSRFSRPTARVLFANSALITTEDGVRSFIFRMANERMNQIVDAEVRVVVVKSEVTAEGTRYRNFYDLSLERSWNPLFALSWTIIHPIDARSPLFEIDSTETLRAAEMEILVTLRGVDETFGQSIHDRFSYGPGDILFDGRYRDIVSRTQDGRLQLDLDEIHTVDEPTPNPQA